MKPNCKQVIAINQTSTTNGATTSGRIDTLGYDWVDIDVITTTSNNVTNNLATLQLLEGDTTVFTNAATISGAVGDTDFTIANAVTSGNWGVKFRVDARARKRYLFVETSPVTTQTITAIANLGKGDVSAENATDAGVKNLVEL